ncbi:hypothetical protein F8388_003798 [Cannabis sativa]|uniref:Rx N-terminal domain-containing protein n=1 Tax=Cannabis sativa TaxID=3483 RepID=A0A7J6DU35_CANSA|nr:hypothetical protein F8388_003798 [Cannabis sativa]
MAEVLVSLVLEQLASFTNRQIEQQWSLVRSGVEEKVENLSNNLEDIQMVLVDADKRQIVDASVKRWLDKLKVVSYEIETTMYEWNTAIALRSNLKLFDKVCFFTLPCLHRNHVHRHGLHRRVGLKIEKLNEKLDRISNEKERYTFRTAIEYESYRSNNTITTSFVDVSKVCGRDVEKKILIDKTLNLSGCLPPNSKIPKGIDKLILLRGKMLFQNWMMSLNNLKSLVLVRCNYCVSLGPFGNLPSLESLTLNFMINVKTLGNEFLGIENTTTTTESFPKLKTLRFIEFWSWEEWKYCSDRSQAIMPRLQFLHFDRCEKLEAPLPEFLRNTMLKTLTIRQCNKLKPLFKEGLRMEELVNILTRHPTNQNSLRGTVHRLADVII